eukprot:SAG31_NODE_28541_length_408_cov_1.165049_1_plen_128_part_01
MLSPESAPRHVAEWLFAPKGTAFLWISPDWQTSIIPPTLSGSQGNFIATFEYTGTRDYAPFAAVPAGLAFRNSVAPDAEVLEYGRQLALWTGYDISRMYWSVRSPVALTLAIKFVYSDYLAELWNTDV